jgi:hypothetical protein
MNHSRTCFVDHEPLDEARIKLEAASTLLAHALIDPEGDFPFDVELGAHLLTLIDMAGRLLTVAVSQ